jgi:hypothetical protein
VRQECGFTQVLLLRPGSRNRLASRKCMMCARNMGAHVRRSTLEYQRYEKTGQELGFLCSQEIGVKKLVSSNWVKILKKESSN